MNAFKKDKVQEIKAAKNKISSNVSSSSWWANVVKLFIIIAFYFVSSTVLTFYQKDLLKKLPFPLSIVILHLALKFCLSGLGRFAWSKWTKEERITLTWKQYMSRVALVAIVSGLDIGLSQWSLEYVTISLYTMTKTTSTPFILLFGLLFKLEKKVRISHKKSECGKSRTFLPRRFYVKLTLGILERQKLQFSQFQKL